MKQELRFSLNNSSDRVIEGRAIVFNSMSNFLGFYETINRSAITQDLIDKSDIKFTIDHNPEKVIARSRQGKSQNLTLSIKEDGLYFRAELPNTTICNDLLEDVRCGNLDQCSFAFTLDDNDDSAQRWEKREDGTYHREILKIAELFDISAVHSPAYSATFIAARNEELAKAEARLAEQKSENEEHFEMEINKTEEIENKEDKLIETVEEPQTEEVTEPDPETPKTEDPESVTESVEEPKQEEIKDENPEPEQRKIKQNEIIMNISLVKLIKGAIERGDKHFNLSLETREEPIDVTMTHNPKSEGDPYASEGKNALANYQSLIDPLYEQEVVKSLGIKTMTGVPYGKIVFPILSKSTCGWAKEIQKAVQTGLTTTNVEMSPKRLAAYVDISKEALLTDTLGVNNAIRTQLYNAVAETIQASMLDNVVGTSENNRPSGILSADYVNPSDIKTVSTFKDLCDLEADLADVHYKNVQYLVSNKAYAALRNMPKSAKTTELVLNGGTIDGVKVTATGDLTDKTIVVGDFSQIALAVWQNAEVTVDDISHAVEGFIRLTINMYADFKVIKPEAFKVAKIA